MNINQFFSFLKKFVLYFLLISFILLNLLDFFNFFSLISSFTGDVEFFKKILSWSLIFYLFGNLSLTRIITGFKNKSYDSLLLFAYSLVAFPSILNFYLNNVDFSSYSIFSFLINSSFQLLIREYSLFLLNSGIVIIFIISVLIFLNLPIHKESFIGSFSINPENYFSNVFKLLLIIGFNLFFVFTFFKFFMEWFALAIDAALVLLGLLYYVYIYIFKHEKELKLESFLKDIVNSGNSFFKQLILYLQDKKTFFIAISLLITIHLVVDIGVYLIPFSTGIDNGLYNVLNNDDTPLKPLIGLENSWIEHQINSIQENSNIVNSRNEYFISIFVITFELLAYILNIGLYFILLVMPFAIFFVTLQNKSIIPSKMITILTISLIIMQLFLYFSPVVNNTISLSVSLEEEMQGIVFQTQPFYEDLDSLYIFEIIATTIFVIGSFLFIVGSIYFKFEKYKPFWISTFYFTILVFFLFYSTVFAQSYITTLYYENFDSQYIQYDSQLAQQSLNYQRYSNLITSNNISKILSLRGAQNEDFRIESDFYTTSQLENINYDIIGIEIKPYTSFSTKYSFNQDLNSPVEIIIYNYTGLFNSQDSLNNIFLIFKVASEDTNQYINFEQKTLDINALNFLDRKDLAPTFLSLVQSIVSLVFISLFYVGGLVAYAIFYRRVVENMKQKLFIRNDSEFET